MPVFGGSPELVGWSWLWGHLFFYWGGRVSLVGLRMVLLCLSANPAAAVKVAGDSRALSGYWQVFWELPGTPAPGTAQEHVYACPGCLLG